jgi:hypothetical protein
MLNDLVDKGKPSLLNRTNQKALLTPAFRNKKGTHRVPF